MEGFLKTAYARGQKAALVEEMDKTGGVGRMLAQGPMSTLRGVARGAKGGLYGAGIGAGSGAMFGRDDRDIMRGALGGAMIGGGMGYGSRHLTGKTMRELKKPWKTMRAPLGEVEAAGVPRAVAREKQFELAEKQFREMMANPETKAQMGSALKGMGLWGAAGAIAGGPAKRAAGMMGPSYGDLYNYYLQSAGGRRGY